MSRVTFREPSGRWGVKGISWAEIPDRLYGALYKLKDYEDTGISPAQVRTLTDDVSLAVWTWEDKENNIWKCGHCGRLHRFEADGPVENGFACCPYCGNAINWICAEAVLDEENDNESA